MKEGTLAYKTYHRIRRFFNPNMYWTQEEVNKAKVEAQKFKWFFSQESREARGIDGATGEIKLEQPVDRIEPSYKLNSELKSFSIHKHEDSCANVYSRCIGTEAVGADFMLSFGGTIDVLKNNQVVSIDTRKVVDVFLSREQAFNLMHNLKNALEFDDEQRVKRNSKLERLD